MRIYIDGKLVKEKPETEKGKDKGNKDTLFISGVESREQVLKEFDLHGGIKVKDVNICFESHKGFDYLYLLIPSEDLTDPREEQVEIYLTDKTLLLFREAKSSVVETWLKSLLAADDETACPEEVLINFLALLNSRHLAFLNEIEDKITDLEDALAKEEDKDYVGEISTLRKQLLGLRRYYESMLAIMEDLEENRNGLLSKDNLRLLHFQVQKLERFYRNSLNLRDYLTQVRESYQALLDIEANKVMKLFTVITAIFLPLTLLVGWYGMNLLMPETAFPYTYPIIILASVSIVVALIIYFKRNRWF